MGNPQPVRELCALISTHHPKLVFLAETWQNEYRMKNLRWRLGFKNFFVVQSNNNGGGIALYFDESLSVSLHSYSERHIDVLIKEMLYAPVWRATFIYGEPHVQNRHIMWAKLKKIHSLVKEPWVVMGDFNEAM